MTNGDQTKPSWSSPLHCDASLALKMQLHPTASYPCDGDGGGGPFFNQPPVFELAANGVLVQRSSGYSASTPSGGLDMNMDMNMNVMGLCGKALFTASQLQELERQKMIHKYILASIPVPPQLLSTSTSPPPSSLSQCNTGVNLRYSSNGSDPEPWRCKRTDGKKWRCSRDVAPEQKYCERHAHKNRPRSRKHVENSPHNFSQKPFVLPSNQPAPLPRSSPSFPSTASANLYDQARCVEWLMRGGNSDDVSARKQQQWEQQLMQLSSSSSRMEVNRVTSNKIGDNHHLSVYHPHFGEKQGLMSLNPHSQLMSDAILNSDTTQTGMTRLFIDAWGKEGVEGMCSKEAGAEKLWRPPPSSSLSLSMCGGDDEKGRDGDGLMLKNQWLNNPVSWMNSSPPGGPLGEALCLGYANTSRISGGDGGGGGFSLASAHPHGYSNSKTNSSSCSKSSCEDGSHALNFIG